MNSEHLLTESRLRGWKFQGQGAGVAGSASDVAPAFISDDFLLCPKVTEGKGGLITSHKVLLLSTVIQGLWFILQL